MWFSYAQYVKITRDDHVLGFKSYGISIYWLIWKLSFLFKQNWFGIDDFLLNFFATFISVLGLQITVTFGSVLGLRGNTGLQPPTRWEPFVAGTMLCRPETTKERVEPTILSIIAIEIMHLKLSIYCALLTLQWKQSLRSSSTQGRDTWSLKYSIAQLDRQNRKFVPILIITEAKNAHFFLCKRIGFVHQELKDIVKMTPTRVESFCKKRDTSQV